MKIEKKAYRRPQLVEYGRLAEVTQGFWGNELDHFGLNNDSKYGCLPGYTCPTTSS
jgi:hypothetical protein